MHRLNIAPAIGVGFALMAAPAGAIIIRHDINPSSYEASPSDYPAVFGLLKTRRGFWDCPATLIAPQWAVTAGHCSQAPRIREALSAGGYQVEIAGRENVIDRIVVHPGGVDIALLHLGNAVTHVVPIALYSTSDEVGRVVDMVGWGDTGTGLTGVTGPDGQFRLARNKIDRAQADIISWTFSDPSESGGDCVELEGISGPGDSGGPAFIATKEKLELAGVSSGQDNAGGRPGTYGVREFYVRISAVRDWIQEVIAARR
jgi:hypothetical protein